MYFVVLASTLLALSTAQVFPEDLSKYLPPPRTYLPPPPPSTNVPVYEDVSIAPLQPQPQPSYSNNIIYFEQGHLINKAKEPGVCDQICSTDTSLSWQKVGTCPAPSAQPFRGACNTECKYDSECPNSEKCCDNGCANVCATPDYHKTCDEVNCGPDTVCVEYPFVDARCVNPTEKPDKCPSIMNDSVPIGGCDDICSYDSECDGAGKCCYNGCANKCMMPTKTGCDTFACKVGYKCTENAEGVPRCDRIPCTQNGQVVDIECNSCTCIQGFLLCSQEECPPVKEGFCPRVVKGYKGACVEECTNDYQCPGARKCCDTGCGDTCQKPVKGIVHPCKEVRFRCGDETICAATRGLCRPGQPCPLSPLCVGRTVPYCQSCPQGKVCVLQKKGCFGKGFCHRQPICIQLYSDNTIFEEGEDIEIPVVDKEPGRRYDEGLFF